MKQSLLLFVLSLLQIIINATEQPIFHLPELSPRKVKINIFTDPSNAGFGKADHDPNVIDINLDLSKSNELNKTDKASPKLMKLPDGQLIKVETLSTVPDDMKNVPIVEITSGVNGLTTNPWTNPSLQFTANVNPLSGYAAPKYNNNPRFNKWQNLPNWRTQYPLFQANLGTPRYIPAPGAGVPYPTLEANFGTSPYAPNSFVYPDSNENFNLYKPYGPGFHIIRLNTGLPLITPYAEGYVPTPYSADSFPVVDIRTNLNGSPNTPVDADHEAENNTQNFAPTVDVKAYANPLTLPMNNSGLINLDFIPINGVSPNLDANIVFQPFNDVPQPTNTAKNQDEFPQSHDVGPNVPNVDIKARLDNFNKLVKAMPTLQAAANIQNRPPNLSNSHGHGSRLLGLLGR